MNKIGSRRDIRNLERRLRDLAEGGSSIDSHTQPELESSLFEMLVSGGPELPAARRMDSLKAAYVERGTSLREQVIRADVATVRLKSAPRVRTYHALARVAAVATVIVALLVGLGFGTAYAMPGNPLYSVKRAAGSVYLSLVSGDQNKADAYASYTNRRLNELKYVEERSMSKWYYSLASDAEGGIENTYGHGKRLRAEAAQKVTAKAKALTLRLEELLGGILGNMTAAQKANLERGLERIRVQLRMRKGAPSGPSQQNGQPDNQNGQPNGPQNTTPNEPQTQPGPQQQQNQQTQPGSPGQPEQPGGPSQGPGGQGQQSPKQGVNSQSTDRQGSTTPDQSRPQAQPDVGTKSR
jgi:hypothetical protein